MIIRKQTIRQNAEEVSMQVSYDVVDIKREMKKFFALFADKCGNTYALNTPLSELDVRHFFEHETFAHFAQKYREQLSAWAFAMALRHKFLFPSEDPTEAKRYYYFADLLKYKSGRPRNTSEDE